ncbi:MAG: hypothetical protein RIC87_18780 [Kiloniellales bacterium]
MIDTILGISGQDYLYGEGGAGDDSMLGESGSDTLEMRDEGAAFGGSGTDSFRFNGDSLGSGGTGGPVLRDFDGVSANAANGEDKLVFATGLETGSFAYIGSAAFSGAGDSEARFDGARQVQVDQDGDGTTDIAFKVNGVSQADLLTASDFVWL